VIADKEEGSSNEEESESSESSSVRSMTSAAGLIDGKPAEDGEGVKGVGECAVAPPNDKAEGDDEGSSRGEEGAGDDDTSGEEGVGDDEGSAKGKVGAGDDEGARDKEAGAVGDWDMRNVFSGFRRALRKQHGCLYG
ncbi:hypothetical protein BDN72DRAFT_866011, partial [Pluteus cervinus]